MGQIVDCYQERQIAMTEVERDQNIKLLKKQFWKEVAELLRVGNPRGTGLINFIRSRIRQTRVKGWEEKDLLIEASIRSVEWIEENCQEIRHPASFLRQVILNILREEVRKNVRNEKMIRELNVEQFDEEDVDSDNEHQLALKHLHDSLKKLSSKDRVLIELRFVEKLSYKQIQEYLLAQGENIPQLDSLRQQMSRALKRLRREYNGSSFDRSSC